MTATEQVVLVVEDNKSNLKLVRDLLRAHGYTVVQATDGSSGWEMAQEYCPNLIILDIKLPGLSGVEVLARLRADKALQAIPVIAVTAFAMKGDKDEFLRRGFDHYISKPIFVPDFLKAVEDLLNSGSRASLSCCEDIV